LRGPTSKGKEGERKKKGKGKGRRERERKRIRERKGREGRQGKTILRTLCYKFLATPLCMGQTKTKLC